MENIAVGVVGERIGQGLPTDLKRELPSDPDTRPSLDANSDGERIGQRHGSLLDVQATTLALRTGSQDVGAGQIFLDVAPVRTVQPHRSAVAEGDPARPDVLWIVEVRPGQCLQRPGGIEAGQQPTVPHDGRDFKRRVRRSPHASPLPKAFY